MAGCFYFSLNKLAKFLMTIFAQKGTVFAKKKYVRFPFLCALVLHYLWQMGDNSIKHLWSNSLHVYIYIYIFWYVVKLNRKLFVITKFDHVIYWLNLNWPNTIVIVLCYIDWLICLTSNEGPSWWSWSWSYGSCIYNYLCNQFLSPLT